MVKWYTKNITRGKTLENAIYENIFNMKMSV